MASNSFPLGIEQLMSACEVKVKHRPKVCQSNKYVLTMVNGDVIVEAKLEPGTSPAGSNHNGPCCIDVYDVQDNLVFSLRQAYTLQLLKIDVFMNGGLASVLRQKAGTILPVVHIHDPVTDEIVLRLKFYLFAMEFKLLTLAKTQIGSISMKCEGSSEQAPKGKDRPYYVRFPRDLDARYKAALLAIALYCDHPGKIKI